ncbi:MAG: hypothetical protein IT163_09830 [Bryobacterales bacterium]|nr:hypothetical protein [Bryobacterales bacterium]
MKTDQLIDPEAGAEALPPQELPGVDFENAPANPPAEKKEDKPEPWEAAVADLRKDVQSERERRIAAEAKLETWMQTERSPKAKEPPPEDEEEVDLVDAISSGDKSQARKALKQLGFIPADEVETIVSQRIQGARQAATTEVALVDAYPDLQNEKSEHYAETAKALRELEQRGITGDMALDLAADRAAARLGIVRKGKGQSAGRRAVERDDEGSPETESERMERIGAQSGGGRSPRSSTLNDDDLSPAQKLIAKKFGVSEDAYRKRAKRGVSISGANR